MTIHYEVTEEDYMNFNLHYIEDSSSQKKKYWTLRILIPLMFASLMFFMGTLLFKQPIIYWLIASLGVLGLWILYFPQQYRNVIKKQRGKRQTKEADNGMLGEKSLTIGENTLTVTAKSYQTIVNLEDINSIEQYSDMIIIYYSRHFVIIIPTRYLTWEEKIIISSLN
ncbi:YcxB family protein [Alkalibacterium kapii]|uniref:YcxB-like protein domain-containing protein n=1 Tax=Alkalibacterium kapii TaxID=426704 RepID=A0A511AX21_9LACT|nr:YcxB family protein [Alkalibacterium kapii]GEK91671.1 hypothetical protein AKA01nite_12930 [Alkalibacterium kapii]